MPHLTQRRSENVNGDFYVDSTCIDCDTCRWMAPDVFFQAGDQSAVHHQPANELERLQAMQALLSCPTASNRHSRKANRHQGSTAEFADRAG